MTRLVDDVVLDPVEAGANRVELNLSEMGLSVYNADFGDNAIEATAIQTGLGQMLVDRRPKPRNIIFDLGVREDAEEEVDLATAAYRLEQKLGTMQERGGWLRRDFYFDSFAGSLLYKVTGEVGLSNILGWKTGDDPGMPTLAFVADLVGYSTDEREQGPFLPTSGGRHMIFNEAASPGTAKGLWRGRVSNNGEDHLRGLILSRECETAPDDINDPTAQPFYLARKLTPKGGAEVKTVSGAEVVQHAALTADWLTILASEIAGVGHMTHKGPRRIWMRVYDPGAEAGGVELRLLWRALGASQWEERMPTVATPVVGGWILVTLGIARPEEAVVGEERWEWKLMARAPSGSGTIRIRDVYALSTEQYLTLSESADPAPDGQPVALPGAAADDSSIGTVAWVNPGGIKTESIEGASLELTGTVKSHYLKATSLSLPLPATAVPVGVVAEVRKTTSAEAAADYKVHLVKAGTVVTTKNKARPSEVWEGDQISVYGGAADLWGEKLSYADVTDPGFGVAFAVQGSGFKFFVGVSWIRVAVAYLDGADMSRVCFAGCALELRSDGVIRQVIGTDVWGRLVPDGFNPYAPAGGLEGRIARTVLIGSAGDLREIPDGPTAPSLRVYTFSRDGYHFAREAAG